MGVLLLETPVMGDATPWFELPELPGDGDGADGEDDGPRPDSVSL